MRRILPARSRRGSDNPRMVRAAKVPLVLLFAVAAAIACSPTFDWRESRPDGAALRMLFPCRPDRTERPLSLAGETVTLAMQSCTAGGATFAVGWADVAVPEHVGPSLDALRAAAAANLGAPSARPVVRAVPGATPNAGSVQVRLEGRLPDGRPVVEHVAYFASGLRVYQAAVIGERSVPDETLETFFGGVRLAVSTSR